MSGTPPSSRSMTAAASRATSSASPTSARSGTPPTSAATASSAASPRATRNSFAPAAAKRFATSRPMPREAPVTSATRPASTPDASEDDRSMIHRQAQELLPRLQVLQEHPAYRARDGLRVLLLHASHHHAQVVRLADHPHTLRLQHIPHRLRDLLRHPFLDLQPAREHLHDARQLRQTHDLPVRDVRHVHLAEERQ